MCSLVNRSGFKDFCFIRDVENYEKIFDDAFKLMQRAKEEIAQCDVLLIEYKELEDIVEPLSKLFLGWK